MKVFWNATFYFAMPAILGDGRETPATSGGESHFFSWARHRSRELEFLSVRELEFLSV